MINGGLYTHILEASDEFLSLLTVCVWTNIKVCDLDLKKTKTKSHTINLSNQWTMSSYFLNTLNQSVDTWNAKKSTRDFFLFYTQEPHFPDTLLTRHHYQQQLSACPGSGGTEETDGRGQTCPCSLWTVVRQLLEREENGQIEGAPCRSAARENPPRRSLFVLGFVQTVHRTSWS